MWAREVSELSATHNRWVQTAHQTGINSLTGCYSARIFFVRGRLSDDDTRLLGNRLLADPVTEDYAITTTLTEALPASISFDHTVEVTFLPGVTDPVAEHLKDAAALLDIEGIDHVATGQRYLLQGDLSSAMLDHLATGIFSNPVIQRVEIDSPIAPPFVEYGPTDDTVEIIDIREADDDELLRISAERRLALDLNEMRAIRGYFHQEGRDPTDAELEMLAQTWSEHCVHKTFKATIQYTGLESGAADNAVTTTQTIHGLLNTYLRSATEKIDKPWVYSAFVDNAGIIAFDDEFDLAFKVETHNHPSAIEPFGGANTGVGGVVRDVLGVSARPIANTDILCFGPPDLPESKLPAGALHPRRIADGVIHGIEDYGNKMGIPTVNGAILYHQGYTANPLVFCGCLGLLPHDSHPTGAQPGDLIIVLGGRTGRDGLRGATFSSMEMDGTTGQIAGSAVQIGNPIQEKQVQEVILQARDARLYSAITDCGAGGLSSAVGEMGQETGARVQLASVPLKYSGLQPWEIWLSEAQERMVMAVPAANWNALQDICAGQDVDAVRIGEFTDTGRLTLFYKYTLVGDVAMDFLHDGIPTRQLEAVWEPTTSQQQHTIDYGTSDLADTLLKLLAQPNIRSKEAVVRRYDHEVQGGTVVKPLTGADNHGPGDAAVLVPLDTRHRTSNGSAPKGVALANGVCPQYGEIDPYAMAWAAIDEAVRNAAAVGADPDQIAILDNFCWGNPNLPDRLGGLVRCVQGCHDAAIAYGTPFISGKDSLNNEYADVDGKRHAIPGTLLISAVGIVPDIAQTVTMDLKASGNLLYLVGETRAEMGGSHYHLIHDLDGGTVPQPVPEALDTMRALHGAIQSGLIQACHDVSEGGLAVALAEMCIAGRLGAAVDHIDQILPHRLQAYFSESSSRFIIEVQPDHNAQLEMILKGRPFTYLGTTLDEPVLSLPSINPRDPKINILVADLEQAWRGDAMLTEPTSKTASPPEKRFAPLTQHSAPSNAKSPRVLILHANGTNRDHEAALACELAGGQPEIVHLNQLMNGDQNLLDYHMLVLPGGFSYGDDLGAGVLWALDLQTRFTEAVSEFVESGRPVLGICNGFQTLVKAGLLPKVEFLNGPHRSVTLTYNESDQFECRWVYLQPEANSQSVFVSGLEELIYCPVAHGEGRIAVKDQATLEQLQADGLIALTYVNADGSPADYPANPNGSVAGIAAMTNPAGNIMGLMPHPEDHIFPWQHPRWHRDEVGMSGLRLFENAIKFVK